MRLGKILILVLLNTSCLFAAIINVPSDYATIGKALEVCLDGDIIKLSPGTYNETLMIDKSISIEGSGSEKTIISGKTPYEGLNTITIKSGVKLSNLSVKNGLSGIFVERNSRLDISDCIIRDSDDGVGFEPDANTSIFMWRCQVIKTRDGVDLESTRGAIINSRFIENIDDGIDVDDDKGNNKYPKSIFPPAF